MERDFTAKCYHQFCSFIEPITDKYWCGILSWLNGHNPFLLPSLSDQLSNWGDILSETAKMELFYKDLLERYHATKERIKEIFEGISTLDRSFAGSADGSFGSCRQRLDDIRQCLKALNQTAFAGTVPPVRFCGLANYFSTASVKLFMEKPLFRLQFPSYMEKLSAAQAPQFTASTFSQLSQQDKQDYVRQCADLCPELAEKLNAIFSDPDWTEQEKQDIKFLIYSAPEPYRTIYLEQACNYKINVFPAGQYEGSCYMDETKEILLENADKTFLLNERGPYTSFFHESGHMLDDYARVDDSLSRNYQVNGESLFDCVVKDVRTYISKLVNENYEHLSESDREALLIRLNASNDSNFSYKGVKNYLPDILAPDYVEIVDSLVKDLQGEANTAAADAYNGVTNCAITSEFGHPYDGYWYEKVTDEQGKDTYIPTKWQVSELWAEFFAAQMIHDEEALASTKQFFPTAYPLLEQMAEDIASK